MAQFLDIPLELLPIIFGFILPSRYLANLCLVNRSFHTFASPRLYHQIVIFPWQKEIKLKIALLFRTLAECPYLARHVQRIELRIFPKALASTTYNSLLDNCVRGIQNCVNLRSCTWTRDGSFNSAVMSALQGCHNLQEIELNGHDTGAYNPIALVQFQRLSKLTLIMPSAQIIDIMPSWMSVTGATLRHLSIICKSSSLITDALLESIAPNLVELDHLHLIGCPKITHEGVGAIVSTNRSGLIALGLESFSSSFDINEFHRRCSKTKSLGRLQNITLTTSTEKTLSVWIKDVNTLLAALPLETLHLNAPPPLVNVQMTSDFWRNIVDAHSTLLTSFSIHRIQIDIDSLRDICYKCHRLEQIFIVAERRDLDVVAQCLAPAHRLRSIHINFPMASGEPVAHGLLMSDALYIARQCSATLTQIGCNTRVWQVNRSFTVNADGETITETSLSPYERPEIPEQFLVARG
ncbi:hypothetical protein BJ138DRAFT_1173181 [Hygrophoropsis aurantiaca]|uniref:Uncharacterized protein n=1 Tax=Hygrophoropsis aurantiaca TaxID=72124 RepID=A0ACB8AAW8_9AGAM|nr:hypothetical protein BJ138DRAFT_1173181 [Hygrophoropsis aurantiaca]